jgi:hypothetical protein
MKQTLTKDMFRFQMNQIRPDNFSYEGQGELFDYLDEMDSELEYDPIAICCDFSQCSLDEFLQAYPSIEVDNLDADADKFEKQEIIMFYIQKHGFWFAFVEDGKEIVFENF